MSLIKAIRILAERVPLSSGAREELEQLLAAEETPAAETPAEAAPITTEPSPPVNPQILPSE